MRFIAKGVAAAAIDDFKAKKGLDNVDTYKGRSTWYVSLGKWGAAYKRLQEHITHSYNINNYTIPTIVQCQQF